MTTAFATAVHVVVLSLYSFVMFYTPICITPTTQSAEGDAPRIQKVRTIVKSHIPEYGVRGIIIPYGPSPLLMVGSYKYIYNHSLVSCIWSGVFLSRPKHAIRGTGILGQTKLGSSAAFGERLQRP